MQPSILICAQSLGSNLSAGAAGEAIGAGLADAGLASEVVEMPDSMSTGELRARILASFAVVLFVRSLTASALAEGPAGVVATDARQSGVACHAICAESEIDPFTARIYDLQTIRQAREPAQLTDAGRRLAREL
jgi:glycerate kinase